MEWNRELRDFSVNVIEAWKMTSEMLWTAGGLWNWLD